MNHVCDGPHCCALAASADPQMDLLAKLFKGFGDPTRLQLLHLLRQGERNVRDLVEATGFSQPNISAHLACLRDCGLVIARPSGRATYYSIADERIDNLFRAAEDIVGRIAGRLCNCERYRVSDGR